MSLMSSSRDGNLDKRKLFNLGSANMTPSSNPGSLSHSLPPEPPHQARLRLPISVLSSLPQPHWIGLIVMKITPSQECAL
jgi:hypothetical protein